MVIWFCPSPVLRRWDRMSEKPMIDVHCVVLLQVHVDRFTGQLASTTSISGRVMMMSVVSCLVLTNCHTWRFSNVADVSMSMQCDMFCRSPTHAVSRLLCSNKPMLQSVKQRCSIHSIISVIFRFEQKPSAKPRKLTPLTPLGCTHAS